jgi:hypothetical protein
MTDRDTKVVVTHPQLFSDQEMTRNEEIGRMSGKASDEGLKAATNAVAAIQCLYELPNAESLDQLKGHPGGEALLYMNYLCAQTYVEQKESLPRAQQRGVWKNMKSLNETITNYFRVSFGDKGGKMLFNAIENIYRIFIRALLRSTEIHDEMKPIERQVRLISKRFTTPGVRYLQSLMPQRKVTTLVPKAGSRPMSDGKWRRADLVSSETSIAIIPCVHTHGAQEDETLPVENLNSAMKLTAKTLAWDLGVGPCTTVRKFQSYNKEATILYRMTAAPLNRLLRKRMEIVRNAASTSENPNHQQKKTLFSKRLNKDITLQQASHEGYLHYMNSNLVNNEEQVELFESALRSILDTVPTGYTSMKNYLSTGKMEDISINLIKSIRSRAERNVNNDLLSTLREDAEEEF